MAFQSVKIHPIIMEGRGIIYKTGLKSGGTSLGSDARLAHIKNGEYDLPNLNALRLSSTLIHTDITMGGVGVLQER